ncbi:MAG: ferritin family protein [Dehalococcoidia bacterium]|nr:ferritin family protein [Dehalococcoidia bacterium]
MALDLINENKIGEAKGTAMEEAVNKNFQGETAEVGLYLAMAWQSHREGYPEVASALESIAWDEARHAVRYAILNGMISPNTKENLEKMLAGEQMANKGKREAAIKAREAAGDETHEVFDDTSRDEARHARSLEGLLKRYFGA